VSREKYMRKRVVEALSGLAAVAVENSVYPGTPDVSTIAGWLELKHLDAWPVRPTTAVGVKTFTVQQRLFLKRWCRNGGRAWVLLRVGDLEWLLLDGAYAADHLGTATKSELIKNAARHWPNGMPDADLYREIADSMVN